MIKRSFVYLMLATTVNGCSTVDFSGLDAKSEFSCKAPQGVSCKSVSGIYANSVAGSLPAQKVNEDEPQKNTDKKSVSGNTTYDQYDKSESLVAKMKVPSSGTPYRSQDTIMRVWIAPWQDTDDRLHDQHYIYTTIKSGSWLIEANRKRIKDEYKSVKPLKQQRQEVDDSDTDHQPSSQLERKSRTSTNGIQAQQQAQKFVMDAVNKNQFQAETQDGNVQ